MFTFLSKYEVMHAYPDTWDNFRRRYEMRMQQRKSHQQSQNNSLGSHQPTISRRGQQMSKG